jgi:hypothetical protein
MAESIFHGRAECYERRMSALRLSFFFVGLNLLLLLCGLLLAGRRLRRRHVLAFKRFRAPKEVSGVRCQCSAGLLVWYLPRKPKGRRSLSS